MLAPQDAQAMGLGQETQRALAGTQGLMASQQQMMAKGNMNMGDLMSMGRQQKAMMNSLNPHAMMAEAQQMQQRALEQKRMAADYLAEQRGLRATGAKGDPDFREVTLGGINEANAQDFSTWCSRVPIESRPRIQSVMRDGHDQIQLFLLTQRFLAFEEAADPKGTARDAQAAKKVAEQAADESRKASQRAMTAAAEAAAAASKEAQAAVDKLMASAVSGAKAAAKTSEDASQRATASAAAAADAAAKEAASAVQKQIQSALTAAEASAKAGEAACKRAQASAESSEATPLMEEIRGLRAARSELDAKLAQLRALEGEVAVLKSHCCIQNCAVM